MPLESGTTLGPYEIQAPLGAGGMGEVYKARDSRLDRTVAIKVLPEHVAADPDLRQRFEREARTVAALNHPHICTLYDIGSQDGIDFLVMEHLDGETLAQRLEKGALPLDQALQVAIEIADALDKAHRQGIVHRDLKPGNIMLTKAGAKLLDFGLAKLRPVEQQSGVSGLPTQSASLTGTGSIIGTLQYMAPEQLEGKDADHRTDIFAFGTVVYEMVTGKKAFEGESQASLIGSILRDQPPAISAIEPVSPPAIDHLIGTCLEKAPEARWQSVRDLERDLTWVLTTLSTTARTGISTSKHRTLWWQQPSMSIVVAGIVVAGTVVAVVSWFVLRPVEVPPGAVVRTSVRLPAGQQLSLADGLSDVAISPDGSRIVYTSVSDVGDTSLWVRTLAESDPVLLVRGGRAPFVSADGAWVGFFEGEHVLRRVPIRGGPARTITEVDGFARGASWGADNVIVYATGGPGGTGNTATMGLWSVSAEGGDPEPATTLNRDRQEIAHILPHVIPGQDAILFTIIREGSEEPDIVVRAATTGEQRVLVRQGDSPRYVSTGHIVYHAQGSVLAVPFDVERLETVGDPIQVLEGVNASAFGGANVDVSTTGSLVYIPESASTRTLGWVTREGVRTPIVEAMTLTGWPRLSPDATRVALVETDAEGNDAVWVRDLRRDAVGTSLSDGEGRRPAWRDNDTVSFDSTRHGVRNVYERRADLSQAVETVFESPDPKVDASWSPDGQTLVYTHPVSGLWTLSLGGSPKTFSAGAASRVSPDGRWVAYVSGPGGPRVYVQPFPMGGSVVPISRGPGIEPVWSRGGRELFYRSGTQMLAVAVDTDDGFEVTGSAVLFEGLYETGLFSSAGANYDVAPDGRFLMLWRNEAGSIELVQNWFEELNQRVPVP